MPDPRNRLSWNATCKVYPAIADLMAVEALIQFYDEYTAPGNGDFIRPSGDVPAGKIWIITFIGSWCTDTGCTIYQQIRENATVIAHIKRTATASWEEHVNHNGLWVLDEGQHFHFEYLGVDATKIMQSTLMGWQVSKY